ncbi:MAB_1171c family putative transporter [Streptomyces sp. NPDC057445]|uniref:MAB_1171c family putative transporter n=1 Tax=Streptomyces sp. NPDC057445 TaxID=3346136 RepID=UPI0036AFE43C
MEGTDLYVPAAALAVAVGIRLPALRRSWHDPLVRSVGLVLALGSLTFVCAAPPTIAAVNDFTGIPNFSGPLVYSLVTLYGLASMLLIISWRGGPEVYVRKLTRRWVSAYLCIAGALPILFALGDAPLERLRDFDTYYAGTPFVREMILLYLLTHTVTTGTMMTMCWRWSRKVGGWLRAGLTGIVIGYLVNGTFSVVKLLAVGARWTGRDWDTLSTDIAPQCASLGAFLCCIGFLAPLIGERLSAHLGVLAHLRRLHPLWQEVREVSSPGGTPAHIWWAPLDMRLTQRVSDIHDGLLNLRSYLDPETRRAAATEAAAAGADRSLAEVVGDAAMVAAAVRTRVLVGKGCVLEWMPPVPGVVTSNFEDMSRAMRHSSVVRKYRDTAAAAARVLS